MGQRLFLGVAAMTALLAAGCGTSEPSAAPPPASPLTSAAAAPENSSPPSTTPRPPATTAASVETTPASTTAVQTGDRVVVDTPTARVTALLPPGSEPDPQADSYPSMPDVLGDSRWVLPECCLMAAVVQSTRPAFPDDELTREFATETGEWAIYDIGPRDGSTIVAVATVADVSVTINGQTMFKDRPAVMSTIDAVELVARSIEVEARRGP